MKTFTKSVKEILRDLSMDAVGLMTSQTQEYLAKYGPNKPQEAQKPALIQRFEVISASNMFKSTAAAFGQQLLFVLQNCKFFCFPG